MDDSVAGDTFRCLKNLGNKIFTKRNNFQYLIENILDLKCQFHFLLNLQKEYL